MASVVGPLLVFLAYLSLCTAVYASLLLALDRLMELLHHRQVVQQFRVVWTAGVCLLRITMAYYQVRQRLRRPGRS